MAMREYPNRPLVGVGAIIVEGNRILLVKRASDPNKGLWSIPGGLVRIGEGLKEAVRREVREETGLEIEVGDLAFVSEEIFRADGVRYHYILIDFFAKVVGGKLKAGSDAMDVAWFDIDRLGDEVIEGVRKMVGEMKAGRKGIFI
jgi:ADP-ribose pyrophosphatase YjhB (NUDIX family)